MGWVVFVWVGLGWGGVGRVTPRTSRSSPHRPAPTPPLPPRNPMALLPACLPLARRVLRPTLLLYCATHMSSRSMPLASPSRVWLATLPWGLGGSRVWGSGFQARPAPASTPDDEPRLHDDSTRPAPPHWACCSSRPNTGLPPPTPQHTLQHSRRPTSPTPAPAPPALRWRTACWSQSPCAAAAPAASAAAWSCRPGRRPGRAGPVWARFGGLRVWGSRVWGILSTRMSARPGWTCTTTKAERQARRALKCSTLRSCTARRAPVRVPLVPHTRTHLDEVLEHGEAVLHRARVLLAARVVQLPQLRYQQLGAVGVDQRVDQQPRLLARVLDGVWWLCWWLYCWDGGRGVWGFRGFRVYGRAGILGGLRVLSASSRAPSPASSTASGRLDRFRAYGRGTAGWPRRE